MGCRIEIEGTKQKSILFDTIYNGIANQDLEVAKQHYAYFRNNETFLKEFATDSEYKTLNWVEDSKKPFLEREINQRRMDENGEPLLQFDSKYGKHFYTNENGIKVFYPIAQNKLNSLFSNGAVRSIAKKLALNFVTNRIGDNFNDFDLSKQATTLRKSIEDKLTNKAEELNSSTDMMMRINGMALTKSIDNIDEWVKHVENYFREIKLVYKETTDTEDIIEEEDSERGEAYGKASFEKSTKDNISSNIKLRLSLITNLLGDKNAKVDEFFFEPELMTFDDVYGDLASILTNKISLPGEDLFDIYLNEISNLTPKKPYLSDLTASLKQMDDYVKAEFVQAFNLHKNIFVGTVYEIKEVNVKDETGKKTGKKYEIVHSVQNLSEVGAKNRFVKNNWHHNFIKIFSDNNNVFKEESFKLLETTNIRLKAIRPNENNLDESIEKVRAELESIGVITTPEGFNHYLDGLQASEVDNKNKAVNLTKLITSTGHLLTGITTKKIKLENNPFDNQIELNNLAKAEAFYLSEGSDSSIFSSGKSKWLYSYPSYLSTRVKQWQKDNSILEDYYNSSSYNKGSFYAKKLLAINEPGNLTESEIKALSKERIDNFNLVVFNSLQEMGDAANSVDNKGISKNDFFADIYNKMLGGKIGRKSYINTATPADKGNQYQFEIGKELFIESNTRHIGGKIIVSQATTDIIFGYVNSEFERMKETQAEIDLAEETGDNSKLRMYKHLNGDKRANGLNFQLFPELNFGTFNAEEAGFSLYDINGKPLPNINLDSIKDKITDIINETISKDILANYKHIRDIGLVQLNNNGEEVNRGFDTEIWNSYGNVANTGLRIAGDVYMNGLISQVEYSKLFAGDVAYYKTMVDYKKRIPGTYTDGLQLYLRKGEETFNIAVMSDVLAPTKYLKELEELVGKDIASNYAEIDSTDAQAWITPNRWKFLKQGLGKWAAIDDVVFAKLMETNKEPFTVEELKRAAQPLKGVYFELNDNVPTYLKYSQAVLIPQLTKNNKGLKKLADKMEADNIDELITVQGIKVGAGEPSTTHDSEGNVLEDFTLNKIVLKNSGWKLQQDLPVKTFKDTDIGSQIQKNIFAGLAFNPTEQFLVGDKEMSGEELINYINSIVENLSNKGADNFKKEFDISSDNKIGNISKLNRALVEELKTRRAPQNVIDALESGVSPFGIPGYQQKLQNIFASITLKRLVKIQTNGGAFIQMANYGFDNDQANKAGVKWAPWAEETTQEPRFLKDDNGEFILSESGRKIVRPGGILISGSLIAKYVPEYAKMSPEKLFGTKENNYTDGLIDQKILKNIIGYRIPNQGLASNDALEVVGILPEGMGDTVVAYTGITKKTGSDFDIDKMYLMIPSFKAKYAQEDKIRKYIRTNLRGITLEKSANNVADLLDQLNPEESAKFNPDEIARIIMGKDDLEIRDDLESELIELILNKNNKTKLLQQLRDNIPNFDVIERLDYIEERDTNLQNNSVKALQNKLIEAYKGVLTHPEVIKDVMTPIDFDFYKDDIYSLFPKVPSTNLSDFNLTNEINLKYEFLAGKAGVGQTSNAVVDHVRGMMADLSFHEYRLGIGKVNTNGETSFDSEYSEELNDKDLKYYAKSTGLDIKGLKKIKIGSSLSALLNAYVDIARDSYITRGNWTTQTSNTGFMLLRAGVHPFYANAIIGQPIIKEYIDFVTNAESKIVKNSGNLEEKFIEKKTTEALDKLDSVTINGITKKYRTIYDTTKGDIDAKKLARLFKTAITEQQVFDINEVINSIQNEFRADDKFKISSLSLQKLREEITNNDSTPDIQINILHKFLEWQRQSKKVTNNINASKYDVTGYGKNVTSHSVLANMIDKLLDEGSLEKGDFKGFRSKLIKNNKLSLSGAYKENIIDWIGDVMEANPLIFLVANKTVVNTFNEISKANNGDILTNEKLATKLENGYYSYIMSGFQPLQMTENDRRDILKTTVTELDAYKKTSKNILIQELDIKIGEGGLKFIGMNNRKKSPTVENDLTTAWSDLLRDNPELGEKLIKYSYLTSGFQMNINQFYTYIPYEWFVKNNLNEYINNLASNLNSDAFGIDNVFVKDFAKANAADYQVVPKVYKSQADKAYISNNYGFVLDREGRGNHWVKKTITISTPTNVGTTIESTVDRLYELQGYTKDDKPVYFNSNSLNYRDKKGFKVYEYNMNETDNKSIFKENNVVYESATKEANIKAVFSKLVHSEESGEIINDANKFNIKNIPAEDLDIRTKKVVIQETTEPKDQIKTDNTITKLKEMFNDGMMTNKFKASGIQQVNDLDNKSESELVELIKKICK